MFNGERPMLCSSIDALIRLSLSKLIGLRDIHSITFQICVRDAKSCLEVTKYIQSRYDDLPDVKVCSKQSNVFYFDFYVDGQHRHIRIDDYTTFDSSVDNVAYVLDERYMQMSREHIRLRAHAKNSVRRFSKLLSESDRNQQELFPL